jgi:uncharacterized membrane protein (DUF4010 family)
VDVRQLEAFFIALFIGALVGIERTHHQGTHSRSLTGIRTFMLFSEFGAVAAWLSRSMGSSAPFVGGLFCATAVLVASYVTQPRTNEGGTGVTTEMAAAVVYVLGGLAVHGPAPIAVALAIVTAGLLAMKASLHDAVSRISREELLATLRLLFASFIVLPLLPNRPVDPWGAVNPFKLWLLVILISGLSMVGYVAVRLVGPSRGTMLAGLFGGLASSTAATVTFARQNRERPELSRTLATGVLLAWTVMFVRVMVLVGALRWPLLSRLVWPMAGMALVGVVFALWDLRGHRASSLRDEPAELGVKNPFRLWPAIKFAALFAVVLVVSRVVQQHSPGRGLYWVSALAGSTDVDTVVLSLSELHGRGAISDDLAVRGMVIASIANTLVKLVLLRVLGTAQIAYRMLAAAAGMIAVGVAVTAWTTG